MPMPSFSTAATGHSNYENALALTAIGFNGHNDIKDELFRQAINPLRLESTPILMLIGEKACGGANRLCHAV